MPVTNSFDRVVVNPNQRPLSADHRQIQSDVHKSLMTICSALLADLFGGVPGSSAVFLGAGLSITAPGGSLNITLNPGLGFFVNAADEPVAIDGLQGQDDLSAYHPLPLDSPQNITVPAPDATNSRIDILEVRTDRRSEDPESKDFLTVSTGTVAPANPNNRLSFYLDGRIGNFTTGNSTTGIGYKVGTPAGSPVAPAGTPGYVTIARIAVPPAAISIVQGNITDLRVTPGVGVAIAAMQATLATLAPINASITFDDPSFIGPIVVAGIVSGTFKSVDFTGAANVVSSSEGLISINAAGQITIIKSGRYRISFAAGLSDSTAGGPFALSARVGRVAGTVGADIHVGMNGASVDNLGTHPTCMSKTAIVNLNGGDTLALQVTMGSSASCSVNSASLVVEYIP